MHTTEQQCRDRRARRVKIPEKKAAILAGEDRYFTGEPCKNGHTAERMVSSGNCVECERLKFEKFAAAKLATS